MQCGTYKLRRDMKLIILICCTSVLVSYYMVQHYKPTKTIQCKVIPSTIQKRKSKTMQKWKNTNRSLTVVSAFFDIGKFPKGGLSNLRGKSTYHQWGKVFRYLNNPLVVYTDSGAFKKWMRKVRNNKKESTHILLISRKDNCLWPFEIMPRIRKLYSKTGYPKHYPNTYLPEYTSLTHSKQPILADSAERNFFRTDYFCWLDIGYFRDIERRRKEFWLEVPSDFDKTKIGVTRVYNVDLDNTSSRSIILQNKNWVGGGLFLGIPETISKFHEKYKSAVIQYLDKDLMNVEQQILYAMYAENGEQNQPKDVDLQLYIPGQRRVMNTNPWFYLGYLMYSENPKT